MDESVSAPTARLSQLRPGARVRPGNEFWGCLSRSATRRVQCDDGGLYVRCREGHHYLDGQTDEDGDTLWGLEVISNG
jgi:hypothetical protein